jgi:hypothetical protein
MDAIVGMELPPWMGSTPMLLAATWASLTVVTLTLLVAVRTNWGRARPMHRCIIVSVLAHSVLVAVAASIQVVTGAPGYGQGDAIMVGAIDFELDEEEIQSGDLPAPVTPWQESLFAEPQETPLDPAEPVPDELESQPVEPSPEVAETPPDPLPNDATEPADPFPQGVPVEANALTATPATVPLPASEVGIQPAVASPLIPPASFDALADWPDPEPETAPPQPQAPLRQVENPTLNHPVAMVAAPVALGAVPELYRNRVSGNRTQIAIANGGSEATETAVNLALKWLSKNQEANGHWDASRHGAGQELQILGRDRQGTGVNADTGVTGLALLAFLGSGHSHREGAYQQTVQRGLEFLLASQADNGSLGGKADRFAFMYCHGIASLAMSEAYALTRDPRLEPGVRKAMTFTISMQHPATGGWRYQKGELGDTSQLGWQLLALKSAELGGVAIPPRTRQGALAYLSSVSSGKSGGLAAYRPQERASRTMTAEALVCRQFLGSLTNDPAAREAADALMAELPTDSSSNFYYWYYATLGLFQLQGEAWHRWNHALQTTLIGLQHKEGELAGSWEPDRMWATYGGRVFSTALGTLCLEVYYRYLPLYVEAAARQTSTK